MSTETKETTRQFSVSIPTSHSPLDVGPHEQAGVIQTILSRHYVGAESESVYVSFNVPKDDSHARANAAGWLESIQEMVAKLDRETAVELFVNGLPEHDVRSHLELIERMTGNDYETDDFEFDADQARETIEQSVLSVEVRSDWYSPGVSEDDDARKPAEFCILLSTGGPALRLLGELDEHGQPTRAWLEYQDWGTPWTHYYVKGAGEVLLTFASVFYFGE